MEKCFADRKDGKCHALKDKECLFCYFYTPRSKIKNNPFYLYSYDSYYRAELDRKRRNIRKSEVMKKTD